MRMTAASDRRRKAHATLRGRLPLFRTAAAKFWISSCWTDNFGRIAAGREKTNFNGQTRRTFESLFMQSCGSKRFARLILDPSRSSREAMVGRKANQRRD